MQEDDSWQWYQWPIWQYDNDIKEYSKHYVPTDPCHAVWCVTAPSVTLSPAISQPIERTPQCDNQCCRVTPRDAAWRRVTRWPLNIASVTASSAPLSPLASSPPRHPQHRDLLRVLHSLHSWSTSVNISSHRVGMYARASQCHPADLHHGDQVRYCQQCGFQINVWICLFRSNQVVETVCYCNTDLCNGAGLAENSVFMMIIFTLYTVNIIMQWIIAWLIVHSRHGYSAFKLCWVRIPTFNVFHTQIFNWLHFLIIKYN